ncbi:Transposon TX1 uncharacterized 82 kDa protein ORF 1 [Larimichthys crocea]|uniref:Transposon TX1 uncharacterized 82 kDa protein ORF 1 n=1 Tax=Larimichthys crocea TaxID=215358 RepID=A0A6G0HET4_LARCR|nr:Transposon TX1 uncharacterized 82 kDa protein ORF 1 [Larimichthys crocea]
MPVSAAAAADFERLTRRHAVKLVPAVPCSVEEAGLAVGEVVGCESIRSASRMNGAIVLFLDATAKVSQVVERGVVIQDTFTPVLPLVNPAAKVIISNAPPFIKNESITRELSRYGQVVSHMQMVSLGCKSAKLKHVVSHRRQVYMVLKDPTTDLNLSFSFKVDGFNYMVFATTETMKCFGCGTEGHLIRSCPGRGGTKQPAAATAAARGGEPPRTARSEAAADREAPRAARPEAAEGGEPPQPARSEAAAGGEPPQSARSEAAAGGEPPQPARSRAAAGGEPPQSARSEAAAGGEPPQPARSEAAAGGEPPQPARSEAAAGGEPSPAAAGGEPPQPARSEAAAGVEPPRVTRSGGSAGGILVAAGPDPLRSQEDTCLEVRDPGEIPLICDGTETGREDGGGVESVTNSQVTGVDEEMAERR